MSQPPCIDPIVERLHEAFGSPNHNNKEDPVDELIFILLSVLTRHQAFNRAYDRLKERFPAWTQMLDAPVKEVTECIESAGLANQRGPLLMTVLQRLKDDFGETSLNSLHELNDEEAIAYLCSLPGVGEKTARCVLMYALKREVLPVDTHTRRVAVRIGLIPKSISASRVHRALEAVVSPRLRYAFHTNAVCLGREVCLSGTPRCVECPIRDLCKTGSNKDAAERAG